MALLLSPIWSAKRINTTLKQSTDRMDRNFCLHVQKTLLIYWQVIVSKRNCKRTNKIYCPVKNPSTLSLLVPCNGAVENHIFAWYKVNFVSLPQRYWTNVPKVLLEGSWQEASKTQTVLWDTALKLVCVDNILCKKWKKKNRLRDKSEASCMKADKH